MLLQFDPQSIRTVFHGQAIKERIKNEGHMYVRSTTDRILPKLLGCKGWQGLQPAVVNV